MPHFAARYARQLSRRSVVLVVGDARTNCSDPGEAAFAEMCDRAGQVYWLNPEPRRFWNLGDSAIERHPPLCDQARECRTLRQIADFVESVAVSSGVRRTCGSLKLCQWTEWQTRRPQGCRAVTFIRPNISVSGRLLSKTADVA